MQAYPPCRGVYGGRMTESPTLSIVVPALDEEDNVGPLVEEIGRVMGDVPFELIVVDDGSRDATSDRLLALDAPWLRVLRRPAARGQSAAMHAGIHAARGAYVAFLDADLQNDPADLPAMLAEAQRGGWDLVQGDRSHARQDHAIRKIGSWVGRSARRVTLGDRVRDTGCSARVVRADYARRLPLQFKGMHRFIPATVQMLGGRVAEFRAGHRPRHSGATKYGLGLLSRGPAGLLDLLAVRWMRSRLRDTAAEELTPASIAGRDRRPSEVTT